MGEYVDVTKAGVNRKLQPQAVVLMDPATGNAMGLASYPLLSMINMAPTVGLGVLAQSANRTFQAVVTGAGAVGASVAIDGSNNGVDFLQLGVITLSGTNTVSDGFVSAAPWIYVRSRLTAISGVGSTVSVYMGV